MTSGSAYEILPGEESGSVVVHVPHSSRVVPPEARASIVLDDDALERELDAMTDARTDQLAAAAVRRATGPRPWRFVNRLSRLVVDPERLPDDAEEMVAVGMGAVYTGTSARTVLRRPDPRRDADFRRRWLDPYAEALADLVDQRVAATGACVLVDLHSYPREPLPYERHATDRRPAVCLGTDPDHTPGWLLAAASASFADVGEVLLDQPFRGTYVPQRHSRDRRVASLMVELRRDAYLDDPAPVTDALTTLLDSLAPRHYGPDSGT